MIVILDFGSQYTQLIARKVRESNVYCEIHPFGTPWSTIEKLKPTGLILSGGPSSVYEKGAPKPDKKIWDCGLPILGICYGLQVLVEHFGGKVQAAAKREYGPATLRLEVSDSIFKNLPKHLPVWMSHGDAVVKMPEGFDTLAVSDNAPHAAIKHHSKKIMGVQFHPEVHHTPQGVDILKNFTHGLCADPAAWSMKSFVEEAIREIQTQVGEEKVILGLSGGVDSAVAAALLHRAIGHQLTAIFVDNGVLRSGEKERIRRIFDGSLGHNLRVIDAAASFLKKLKKITEPERKRKIIGAEFIRVFDAEANKIKNVKFLAQGTLYPDVIESVSVKGPSATIKTHHNVGGLPKKMKLKLVEPLRYLFKDEVRALGRELGLPSELLNRHPFPGPGLAIRILGEVTKERVRLLQEADLIVETEIRAAGLYDQLWQAFAVLLPVKSVGVMGDQRTYENTVAVRAVTSQDAMTADWADLPRPVLSRISNRIINEVKGINRVVLDISSKPPATIEWE
ncbi:MAG: GMP synthase [glutamine-hydrolyzing] [Elusimicrobia bacterium]|nr:GMP synthase [glutamine-hydrolyzing] [Elusimicrobiota bacterium]